MRAACQRVRLLAGWRARARGLLGTDATAAPVLLAPCASIHTFGMRYPIDVAFLASDGTVMRVERALGPGRVRGCVGAQAVLERPHEPGTWLASGSRVELGLLAPPWQELSGRHGGSPPGSGGARTCGRLAPAEAEEDGDDGDS